MRIVVNKRHLLMFTKTDQYSVDFWRKKCRCVICFKVGSPKMLHVVKVMLH